MEKVITKVVVDESRWGVGGRGRRLESVLPRGKVSLMRLGESRRKLCMVTWNKL